MRLSKRDFMEEAWVPISKRIPNGSFLDLVFCYNSKTGYFSCWPASLANQYAQSTLNGDNDLSWDRVFTHWMPCYPPKNGITYAEYNKVKKTGRRS